MGWTTLPRFGGMCGLWLIEGFYSSHKSQNRKNSSAQDIVCGSGLTNSVNGAHQQREIACRSLDQQFLVDIFHTAYPEPVQAAGIELVCEVAFDLFPAPALQPFAAFAPHPPPVGIDRSLLRCFAVQLR